MEDEITNLDLLIDRGVSLSQSGGIDQGIAVLDRVLYIDPTHRRALFQRGLLLAKNGRVASADETIAAYASAIQKHSPKPSDLNDLARLLRAAGRCNEAIVIYDYALAVSPDSAALYFNRGNAYTELCQFDEAEKDFNCAIERNTRYWSAFINRGNLFLRRGNSTQALADYEEALRIDPSRPLGHYNRGNALYNLGRIHDALESYEVAASLAPGYEYLIGKIAHLRGHLCRWSGEKELISDLVAGIAARRPVSESFPLFMLIDDPFLQRRATEKWVEDNVQPSGRLGHIPRSHRKKKIHIAYLSADFHEHATSYLAAELFEEHDRDRFQVTAISFGPNDSSPMRSRLKDAFDRFLDVSSLQDIEVASTCRELNVDIAIDLKGYLKDSRPNILAERCAPVQVNWLAFPGTMATPHVDYIIADHTIITRNDVDAYSEKIIWLPDCYQVNDSKRKIADVTMNRSDWGLPESGFIFCCFNNSFKIRPSVFNIWMRILRRVPNGVLWLLAGDNYTRQSLLREAESYEIDVGRLIFADRVPVADHLARNRLADLFLDTWPYNAHTTASEALWAGLPVLTRRGQTFASRVGASLLQSIGLSELITECDTQYEELAVELGTNPGRLRAVRRRLADNRATWPLFDCARFARNIEMAYTQIMERHWKGEPNSHIDLAASLSIKDVV